MNFFLIKIYTKQKEILERQNKQSLCLTALNWFSVYGKAFPTEMMKSYKVRLKPNNKQRNQLLRNTGVARFAYNFTIEKLLKCWKENHKVLSDRDIRKEITVLKQSQLAWLYNYDCDIVKQAVKDACKTMWSYVKYLSKCKKECVKPKYKKGSLKRKEFYPNYVLTEKDMQHYPCFKSKRKSIPSFYTDVLKIRFIDGKVKIPKINTINLYEKDYIPKNVNYLNPRITFDGIDWWISVSVDEKYEKPELTDKEIGIDVGIKEWATLSDGTVYHNIAKGKKFKKLEKAIKQKQRQVSRKYEQNKQDEKFVKTKNILKIERRLRKKQIKQNNLRMDYFHKITTEIVRTKPFRIVHEDLNIRGMMKNRHLSKAVQQASMYTFLEMLDNKAKRDGIEIVKANRYYPSSKLCSNCGTIKKDLKLSDRVYHCPVCGLELDRDYNASINLRRYPQFEGNLSLWRTKQTKVA